VAGGKIGLDAMSKAAPGGPTAQPMTVAAALVEPNTQQMHPELYISVPRFPSTVPRISIFLPLENRSFSATRDHFEHRLAGDRMNKAVLV
jgi:hypothetical protein